MADTSAAPASSGKMGELLQSNGSFFQEVMLENQDDREGMKVPIPKRLSRRRRPSGWNRTHF